MYAEDPALADLSCQTTPTPTGPLTADEINPLCERLSGWRIVDNARLVKRFAQPDFLSALALTNAFGGIAEDEGHHPDLTVGWGKVIVELWTHDVDGLSIYDFIVAAKLDAYAARSEA
ncbi:MAG: 4a-hydroxytetrahydrobiopterin dehydratase [Myxococcota bacterium]|nr:4a-hydroxytetrahydrobiopterin dehydratase [Myxococcota bacterium]